MKSTKTKAETRTTRGSRDLKTALKRAAAALEKDGYRGLYTLETRYTPPGGTPMQGTEETLAGLKKILA
jgi:hypothetical protein